MKKIFIAGCGGMLGDAFHNVFKDEFEIFCSDIITSEKWLEFLDFRNFNNYYDLVNRFKPDYLFHLGAHTDLEYCEINIDDTYITNTTSVEYAVHIANELSIPIIYISTAGIFDGKKDEYDDWDKPNPLNHYGKSKYNAEKFVQYNAAKYLILRAGWMMGGGPTKDKKFVNKILKQIKNGYKEINVVDDKMGTPTYTIDFAKNCKKILIKEQWGLYNLVCSGLTDRYEVASEILDFFKLNKTIKLNKVRSDFFIDDYFAPRPKSERLVNKKLQLKSLDIMRNWKVCLEEYLSCKYQKYL